MGNRILTRCETEAYIGELVRKLNAGELPDDPRGTLIAELEACLKIAMDEWAGWLDDSRGVPPERSSESALWDRCKKALE